MQNEGTSEELGTVQEQEDNISSLAELNACPSGDVGRSESLLLPEPSSNSPQLDLEASGPEQGLSEGAEGFSHKGKETRRSQEQLLKNRSAQRRFRERQKGRIIELEDYTGQLSQQLQQLKEDKEALQLRNAALVRLAEQKSWQLEHAKKSGFLPEEDVPVFTDALELTIQKGRPISLQPEQVHALRREDLVQIWKEYTQRLAACLAVEAASCPQIETEISQFTSELIVLLLRVSICSPLVLKAFAAHNMENTGIVEDDMENLYRSLVAEMNLSLSQRQEMIQLRQLFLSKQHAISRQRSDIVFSLVELQNNAQSFSSEQKASSAFLQAHEAALSIRQSLKEEHSLKLDFMSTVFKHLMQPRQLAQCIVRSYPWFPDTFSLTTWVAADAGDSHALSLFGNSELRHLSSQSGLSGFGLSRGGSVRSLSGGALHSTPHTSAGTNIFPALPFFGGPSLQTLSGQSGMQAVQSPNASSLMHSQPSQHHFANRSPAASPRFHPDPVVGPDVRGGFNPFAEGGNNSAWGL